MRDIFVAAYTDPRALHCGFEHYRSMASNSALIRDAVATGPLDIPILALGGNVVGSALGRQLAHISHTVQSRVIPQCGHIVPADAPTQLVSELRTFLLP